MSLLKTLFFVGILGYTSLFAQSFYVLSGVDSYTPIIGVISPKVKQYSNDIKSLMTTMSKEIGVSIKGHSSRVLAFVIQDVSLGAVAGLKVNLELGEYVSRKGATQSVFGITYMDSRLIAPNFNDEDDVDDQLDDAVEEMLEKFKHQYVQDNKKLSVKKTAVTHEDFARVMHYETQYKTAFAKAKKENKPLFIFMTTSYCPWCRKLENRILSQDTIDKQIKNKYVPVMLNLDKDTFPPQFGKTHFTPILYIVNSKDGSTLHQFTGYNNRGEFLRLLKEK